MKTATVNNVTYELREKEFKPAYIKFDQDMFDDEIYPVLVGLGFEVQNLDKNWCFIITNDANRKRLVFSRTMLYLGRTQCHTAQEFLNASGIFAVTDELPKDWYIEVTEENLEELDAWRKSVAAEYKHWILKKGYFVLSKHHADNGYVWASDSVYSEKYLLEQHPNYKKIDLATFRKITNTMKPDFSIKGTKLPTIPTGTFYRANMWDADQNDSDTLNHAGKNFVSYGLKEFKGETYVLADVNDYEGINYWMFKLSDVERLWKEQNQKQDMEKSFTITAEQAQSIINIACGTWKEKLAEKWANNIVLNKEIEISEEFYKEMRKACTEPQNKLFDEIFGKDDDGSVDLSRVNRPELQRTSIQMIQVRSFGEYIDKAFYLSDNFNWELKMDSEGFLCLIPTKKK